MKKIVINGDYLVFKTFAGVSRFATEIINELDKLVSDFDVELLTPEYCVAKKNLKNIQLVKYGSEDVLKWKNTSLPRYVNKNNALLVDLTQAFPFGVNGITCVHDCIPELVESAYTGFIGKCVKKPLKLIQRRNAIKKNKEILTVSEFSKSDISRIYNVEKSKITVVGNSWEHILRTEYDDSILNKYNINDNQFCFSLGSRVEHKNLRWIVEAARQNAKYKFVVSGENSYSKNFETKKFPENVIFTGYISDGQIRSLMAKCKAFILPSFYEGFGIPPMEALAENTQAIVSNAACLPEIYGKSVHYIDPYKYSGINIDKILEEKVSSPREVLDMYSWKKSAQTLLQVIKKCIS